MITESGLKKFFAKRGVQVVEVTPCNYIVNVDNIKKATQIWKDTAQSQETSILFVQKKPNLIRRIRSAFSKSHPD